MEKLTFREVIANIKEGEVWESQSLKIFIDNNSNEIVLKDKHGFFNCQEIGVKNSIRFNLKRNKVSFQEAFKAYESGKEIESCESGLEYRIKEGIVEISANKTYEDTCGLGESIFSTKEIKGKWYINS